MRLVVLLDRQAKTALSIVMRCTSSYAIIPRRRQRPVRDHHEWEHSMTMSRAASTRLCQAACVAALTIAAASPVEAAISCRARMSGEGTGTGLFGQGTALARQNAVTDWTSRVGARHGRRFVSFSLSRSVTYDCRQGAILQAKCVVTAQPCGDIPVKRKKRRPRR